MSRFLNIASPTILPKLLPNLVWRVKDSWNNKIYLTFDDGPTPEITNWVLDELKKHNALATFFCLGKNVEEQPDIYNRIIKDGHAIGNHTFNHSKGWKCTLKEYVEDIEKAAKIIKTNLFRPPYGKITPLQIRKLKTKYKIVMWDVLSRDYDSSISGEECLAFVKEQSRPGSIVVFHDSLKAEKNLKYVLPRILEYYKEMKYELIDLK